MLPREAVRVQKCTMCIRRRIIHFKGESTRRSNIDELGVFYGAMELFVQKHFNHSRLGVSFLRLGIALRAAAAWFRRAVQPMLSVLLDFVLVAAAMIAAEWLYFGRIFYYPAYAYPIVWTVPGLLVIAVGAASRLYSSQRLAVFRAAATVGASYLVISAMVFFAKTFAFSRAVVLISGMLSMVLLPGLAHHGPGMGTEEREQIQARRHCSGAGRSSSDAARRVRKCCASCVHVWMTDTM